MCNQTMARSLCLCRCVRFCVSVWVKSDVCGNITKPLQRIFHYLFSYLNCCECQKVSGGGGGGGNKKAEPKC